MIQNYMEWCYSLNKWFCEIQPVVVSILYMNGPYELCRLISASVQILVAAPQLSTWGLDSHILLGVLVRRIGSNNDHVFSFCHVFNH